MMGKRILGISREIESDEEDTDGRRSKKRKQVQNAWKKTAEYTKIN